MPEYAGPEGTLNFRAVGPLPAAGGRQVVAGKLYRSDTLQFLSENGVLTLTDGLGVRTVLDLRLDYELTVEGRGVLANTPLVHHHLPFWVEGSGGSGSAVPILDPDDPIVPHYLGYLTSASHSVVGVVQALAADPDETLPAVVHCTAGKDRTGVAVAMILSVLGVGDDVIADEYATGSERVELVMARLRSMASYGDTVDRLPAAARIASREYMVRFLVSVRKAYGSPREYLLRNGVTEEELDRLHAALTEPRP